MAGTTRLALECHFLKETRGDNRFNVFRLAGIRKKKHSNDEGLVCRVLRGREKLTFRPFSRPGFYWAETRLDYDTTADTETVVL